MKTSEQVYTSIVLCLVGLCIVAIANFQLIIIPKLDNPDSVRVFHFVTVLFVLHALSFGVTSFINLTRRELETVPTVIQIVTLFMFGFGLPLAIWGIVLLVKRKRNANRLEVAVGDANGPVR